jgi:hypothetical protein
MALWEVRWFAQINSLNFCPFKLWVAVTGLPDCSRWFRTKFPTLYRDSSPNGAQYLCPQYLHHKKPINASEFQWKFHFHASNPQYLFTVCCTLIQFKTSHPFWTEYNANHYVYQAVPHGRLKLKEHWTSWDKLYLKFTPRASDTFAEAPLMTVHKVKCALYRYFSGSWRLWKGSCTGSSFILVSSVIWRYTADICMCSYVLHSCRFLQLYCRNL